MKLNIQPRANVDAETTRWFKEIARQVNAMSEGAISAKYTAGTAAPTTGTWSQGDLAFNATPTELGVAGSKYVITQWVCVASGTPGTWVACRSLTGN